MESSEASALEGREGSQERVKPQEPEGGEWWAVPGLSTRPESQLTGLTLSRAPFGALKTVLIFHLIFTATPTKKSKCLDTFS